MKDRPKKRKIPIKFRMMIITGFLLFAVGIAVLLYPVFFTAKTKDIQEKLMDSLKSEQTIYIEELPQAEDIFDPLAQTPDSDSLEETASQTSNASDKLPLDCIGIMRIAKINLVLPIVEGLTYKHLSYALAHLQTSAEIGTQGDCCIFGHRNHTYGKYFNRLDELEVGDIISIEDSNGTLHSYTVVKKEILSPSDVNLLKSGLQGHCLSLITCHPIGVYNKRLVIRAIEPY